MLDTRAGTIKKKQLDDNGRPKAHITERRQIDSQAAAEVIHVVCEGRREQHAQA